MDKGSPTSAATRLRAECPWPFLSASKVLSEVFPSMMRLLLFGLDFLDKRPAFGCRFGGFGEDL
jgi:hypothetical protein